MKNSKRNGMGVSEPSLQSTAHSRQLRNAGAKSGPSLVLEANRRRGEIDAGALWKQVEDVVAPHCGLRVVDHVVYVHLLRHSRLEGRRRLHFSITWLAGNIRLSMCATREAVRRLVACGVLRLVERSKQGHVAEVRLPKEVPGVRAVVAALAREAARLAEPPDVEKIDFFKTVELRKTIHARERGRCFYCRRRIPPRLACLDHVVARARAGCNSYRNLVSSCLECNSEKGERPAEEFLRWLFREHRLSAAELRGRFEAVKLLAAGKLRPTLASGEGEVSRRD
jgi:5-methylcytosine-specific restriction endonuclease McrA